MEDYNKNEKQGKKKIQIPIERHKWPDEIEAEKKARKSRFITLIVVAVIFFTVGIFIGTSGSYQIKDNFGLNKIGEIENIMTHNWYFGKDIENLSERLSDQSIQGMLDFPDIDKHTNYMSREQMEQYSQNLSGTYVGIGIQYYQDDNDNFIIQKVFPASPAATAGLEPGDMIIKVNKEDVTEQTMDDIKSLVLGESGSKVNITVLREGKEKSFDMERAEVAHSVNFEVLDEAGYIELTQFGESTANETKYVLNEFKNKKIDRLILDLRDNGGGYLDSVVDIAGYFIGNDEVVLIQEDKNGEQAEAKTETKETFEFDKIIVLVDEGTASASEVLVAALKHHLEDVKVVGTNSYGKGTVQTTRVLGDGSALKYTIAEWFSPSGKKLNHVGIKPDYEVNLHPILSSNIALFEEGNVYEFDSVGEPIATTQMALDFLGYDIARQDGYFDDKTLQAINSFQKDKEISVDGRLTKELYEMIFTSSIREWSINRKQHDVQMAKAVELAHE